MHAYFSSLWGGVLSATLGLLTFLPRIFSRTGKWTMGLGRVHRASKSAMSTALYPTHCKNRKRFEFPVFLFGNLLPLT